MELEGSALSNVLVAVLVLAVLWLIILLLYKLMDLKKYGVELKPYLTFLWRTTRLNPVIDKIASKCPTLWKSIFTVGVFLALGQLIYIFIFLSQNLVKIQLGERAAPVLPLIPGLTIGLESIPYFITSAIIVFCFHELFHGIAARVEGIRVKSIGFVMVIAVFGGFAELSDEDVDRAPSSSKLRLLAAGSMANIACGVLAALLIMNFALVLSPVFDSAQGVLVLDVLPSSPASRCGMRIGDVIMAINGVRIHDTLEFIRFMQCTPANSSLVILLSDRELVVRSSYHPFNKSIAFLGIRTFNYYPPKKPFCYFVSYMFPWYLYSFLSWLEVLSISAALINMLPIPVFDGNRFFEVIFQQQCFRRRTVYFMGKKMSIGEAILSILRFTALLLLILNISFSLGFGRASL